MKKIVLSIITCLTLGACTDFIQQNERGVQNLDNYFSSDAECQTFINDIYAKSFYFNDWWQLVAPRVVSEMATDDAWMGNTGQDASGCLPAAHYVITPNRMGQLGGVYRFRYETIMACNIAIKSIATAPITQAEKDQNSGEALFLRAYNYYELVNNFGGMALITEPLSTSELNVTRSSKEDTYALIESDLKSAMAKLPTSYDADNKGRATKWACCALLARVSLFQEKWSDAYSYADTVIQHGGFSLEPNFVNIWDVNNHNGVESIFEAQTSAVPDKTLGNMMCTYAGARGESKDAFPSGDAGDVMDGWGWGVPTSDLENCYLSENDDVRRKCTIARYNEPVYGDEVLNPTYYFDLKQNKSGRVIRKFYIPVATRRTLVSKQNNAPLNVPILRLAEMYLTRAEAAYHGGGSIDPMSDVDIVRQRVGLPAKSGTVSGVEILRAIWKERRMEFAFEGLRLYDIRREIDPSTNKPVICSLMGPQGSFVKYNTTVSTDKYETKNLGELQDKGISFDPSKNLVWPIPQYEIDRSHGVIAQNPNY